MPATREPDHATLKQVFSNQVRWVEPDTSVQTIAEIMRDLRLSCVVVCDQMRPVGVISERDLCKVLANIVESAKTPEQLTAQDVMSSPVVTTRRESTLSATSFRMQQHGIRRLPVVDEGGRLIGILTQTDLVAALVREQERSRIRLEEEIWRSTAELTDAKSRLRASESFKSRFLTHISHEIRTPMTSILGELHQLPDPDLSAQERRDAVNVISTSGEQILEILNEILDLGKLDSGNLELKIEPVSLFEILDEVKHQMNPLAEDKGLELRIDYAGRLPEFINTDARRLRQILLSLVDNAIKYTEAGRVVIRPVCHERTGREDVDDSHIEVEISDTGIGMEEAELARAFMPFEDSPDDSERHSGGVRLGLPIARRLARLLGGGLTIDSWPNEGTRVRLSLAAPSVQEAALHTYEQYSESAWARRAQANREENELPDLPAHILVVEDIRTNRLVIERILRRAGARISMVDNGQAALFFLLQQEEGEEVDIVLMDIQMPVMDGYEATRRLRDADYTGPIIALTASVGQDDRRRCIAAGCDAVAEKPIDRGVLFKLIHQYIGPEKENQPETVPQPVVELTELQRDMLGEFLNMGLGSGADALSTMTGDEVALSIPEVEFVTPAELRERFERLLGAELSIVRQLFTGSFEGEAFLLFSSSTVLQFVRSCAPEALPLDLSAELERDVLSEVGNIVLNAFMSVFTDQLSMELEPHIPRVQHIPARELMASKEGSEDSTVMLSAINFGVMGNSLKGYLGLHLDPDGCNTMIEFLDRHLASLGLD